MSKEVIEEDVKDSNKNEIDIEHHFYEEKPVVFMFKNQVDFRKDRFIDLWILKVSIKQWFKLYKHHNKTTYICGSYTKEDIDEIVNYLTEPFIKRYNIKIINIGGFPKKLVNKSQKVNYQLIKMWQYLQTPFAVAHNDVFPIKPINDDYMDKEYEIISNDYKKIPENKIYWWLNNQINTLEYLNKNYCEKFGKDKDFLKITYGGHSFYSVNKEFMEFFMSDEWFLMNADRDVVLTNWKKLHDKKVYIPGFIGTTFHSNKWIWDKKKEKQYKGIDATLPNHPKAKNLIKKLTK